MMHSDYIDLNYVRIRKSDVCEVERKLLSDEMSPVEPVELHPEGDCPELDPDWMSRVPYGAYDKCAWKAGGCHAR